MAGQQYPGPAFVTVPSQAPTFYGAQPQYAPRRQGPEPTPWQINALRIPGMMTILAGILFIASAVSPWFELSKSGQHLIPPFTLSPVGGVSAGGSLDVLRDHGLTNWIPMADATLAILALLLVGVGLIASAAGVLLLMARARVLSAALLTLALLLALWTMFPARALPGTLTALSLQNPNTLDHVALESGATAANGGMALLVISFVVVVGLLVYREITRMLRAGR